MRNPGGLCALKAIVHCLAAAKPLTYYFLTREFSKHLNRTSKLGSGGQVAVAYFHLLRQLYF